MHRLAPALRCTNCKSDNLGKSPDRNTLICTICNNNFNIKGKTVLFCEALGDTEIVSRPDGLVFKIKNFLKRHPKLFSFIYRLTVFTVGTKPQDIVNKLSGDALVVSIGSGIMNVDPRVINVDINPYPNVDVQASAYNLPFKNESVDMIISESLLEHLERPVEAINEMERILKKGGWIYIVTPFVFGFHSSPGDYYRWTTEGMREIFKEFVEVEIGVNVGPTSALTSLLREWLAILLSFNSKTLYQLWTIFFMVVFIPVNLIDFLIYRLKFSTNVAQALCYIGRKR